MEENSNTCKKYIDFLLLTGFHKNTNKDYFYEDLGKINEFCNLTTNDMYKIKKMLNEIRSKN